ncbi:MAG TPA: response regulator [Gammaproteobacteria bacterium]
MTKTALIVDDSASARFVLGGVLAEQSLTVDTAASGEEALEYLRHSRPDVIFMDHLMPGMDGFQALEAIKENPATATIPVMMYTSQEGELYVGQARALGAIGVLPKQVHPVEVTKVLEALHLIPGDGHGRGAEEDAPGSNDELPFDPADSARINAMLEDLFDQQRAVLRDDIRRGYEQVAESTASLRRLDIDERPRDDHAGLLVIGLAILAATTISFAYLYLDSQALLDRANERITLLVEGLQTDAAQFEAGSVAEAAAAFDALDIAAILEWGVNQAQRYPFGETALDGSRAALLTDLGQRMRNFGVSGAIGVDVHVGRFCMNAGAEGLLELAPPQTTIESCHQLGWPETEALAFGAQQTLPFANAIALESRDGQIRFEISSYGSTQPTVAYPAFTQGLTAGEWNAIAAANHRVEVRILPD